ncbi:cupin domain-containing protein [Methylobacterium sp. WSM2598]|uniref:cupin domain-containing protein n=1 Tax=Methylobacterium sp. WSM2598 TaxID=398261 RepID=UPI0009FCD5E5|nr:cupin domain-containing protein [Methylobacterium sp. WSM2598]
MLVSDALSAEDVVTLLGLEPNATCGCVRATYHSARCIAPGGLAEPFGDGRPLGSALYFMVTPLVPVRLHRIQNDQLYHYYLGNPLEVFLLHPNGAAQRAVVGPNLRNGERVQLLIPGGVFHTARLIGQEGWFLGASTAWPGVTPADAEIGDVEELSTRFPVFAADLRAIAGSAQASRPPKGHN